MTLDFTRHATVPTLDVSEAARYAVPGEDTPGFNYRHALTFAWLSGLTAEAASAYARWECQTYGSQVYRVTHSHTETLGEWRAREYSVCHECACILVNGEGDPERYAAVGAWSEREYAGHLVMTCGAECEHTVSYALPCDVCGDIGTPFGLHTFTTI